MSVYVNRYNIYRIKFDRTFAKPNGIGEMKKKLINEIEYGTIACIYDTWVYRKVTSIYV